MECDLPESQQSFFKEFKSTSILNQLSCRFLLVLILNDFLELRKQQIPEAILTNARRSFDRKVMLQIQSSCLEMHPSCIFCHVMSALSFQMRQKCKRCYECTLLRYRVFLKKVLHKREEKMQEKMKMAWQKDKSLVQVRRQCSVYFCIKIIFESGFFGRYGLLNVWF